MLGKILSIAMFAVYVWIGHLFDRQTRTVKQNSTGATDGNSLRTKDVHRAPLLTMDDISHTEPLVDNHIFPKYEYKYNVGDHKTGDYKSQRETRSGDVVKGEYSVVGPDGIIRKTIYTVNKDSGFNAIVTKIVGQTERNKHFKGTNSVGDR